MKNKNYTLISFIIGFTVWFLATLAFRLAGQYFFITDNTVVLLAFYIMLIPVLGFLAISVFKRFDLNHLESIKSASVMVLPGMLLDTIFVHFFAEVFPNMPESDGNTFGSWLMFAYSIILLSALFRTSKRQNT